MSNEVKTKVDLDPKYIIKLTVTLFVTCVIVAGLLGGVNAITKEKIDAINWNKTVEAMKVIIPALQQRGYQLVTVSELLRCSKEGLNWGWIYSKAD